MPRWNCNPIYLLLLTYWCRDPCLRWSDFQDLEIFRDFQQFSRFIFGSMSEYESSFKMSKSFIVFSSFAINTSKLLEYKQFEFLNSDLCQIESSSQQNVIISTVFKFPTFFYFITEKGRQFFILRSDFGRLKSDAEPINLYKSKSERKEESLVSTILDYSPWIISTSTF